MKVGYQEWNFIIHYSVYKAHNALLVKYCYGWKEYIRIRRSKQQLTDQALDLAQKQLKRYKVVIANSKIIRYIVIVKFICNPHERISKVHDCYVTY